jgi:N-methylhydantoinase B
MEKFDFDIVLFDILKNSVVAAVHESSTLLEKMAYHPVASLGRDRTSGLITPEGYLVAHGHSDCAPHFGTLENNSQELLKDIPISEMQPGDVYIFNDPHRTGRHCNDVGLHRPIFYNGEVVAFALVVLHWADVGGPMPGTFNPEATEAYAEGIRIPPTKIVENGKIVEPVWRIIAKNIRSPLERRADVTAQVQATKLIEERVLALFEKYGTETMKEFFKQSYNWAATRLREEVLKLPDGEYEFEDFGDMDTCLPDKPPIRVHCKLTVKSGTLTFDFSNSGPAPKSSWGAPRTTTIAGTMLGMLCHFPDIFPINHGILDSVKIITKPGTCVHVLEPAGTTGYCSGSFDKCEVVVTGCLAQPLATAKPHRVYGGWVSLTNLCIGGVNPKTKREFVDYTWAMGGGCARTFKDGPSFAAMRFVAMTNTIPMELEERWFPLLYTKFEALPDSCGHGKFRGGFGLERRLKVLADAVLTIHGDREIFPPNGVGGGLNALGGTLKLNVGTPEEKNLGMYATGYKISDKDEVCFTSSGGGGFGDPLERDPNLVLRDVMNGYLSLEAARKHYGVSISVIDEDMLDYSVNKDETRSLRRELAKKPKKYGTGAFEINPQLKDLKISRELGEEEALRDCALVRPPGW